jgi:enamine deaminase RidA (YjgF/YER057c/UK114 family)
VNKLRHDTVDPPILHPTQGGYAHAVEVSPNYRYLFISGQIPVRPDGTIPETFADQCHVVWDNLLAILSSAGYEAKDLVKVSTFLSSAIYGDENGEIRRNRLGELRPALTVVLTGIYDKSWLLEIEAVAAKPA